VLRAAECTISRSVHVTLSFLLVAASADCWPARNLVRTRHLLKMPIRTSVDDRCRQLEGSLEGSESRAAIVVIAIT
jgi:hypothetical protein